VLLKTPNILVYEIVKATELVKMYVLAVVLVSNSLKPLSPCAAKKIVFRKPSVNAPTEAVCHSEHSFECKAFRPNLQRNQSSMAC